MTIKSLKDTLKTKTGLTGLALVIYGIINNSPQDVLTGLATIFLRDAITKSQEKENGNIWIDKTSCRVYKYNTNIHYYLFDKNSNNIRKKNCCFREWIDTSDNDYQRTKRESRMRREIKEVEIIKFIDTPLSILHSNLITDALFYSLLNKKLITNNTIITYKSASKKLPHTYKILTLSTNIYLMRDKLIITDANLKLSNRKRIIEIIRIESADKFQEYYNLYKSIIDNKEEEEIELFYH